MEKRMCCCLQAKTSFSRLIIISPGTSFAVSCTHLLRGACDPGGGPVLSCGRHLSSRGTPGSQSLLGHRPAGPDPDPCERGGVRVQLLLPAPSAQHEREEAGLSGDTPCSGRAAEDHEPPGGSVWVWWTFSYQLLDFLCLLYLYCIDSNHSV